MTKMKLPTQFYAIAWQTRALLYLKSIQNILSNTFHQRWLSANIFFKYICFFDLSPMQLNLEALW